MKTENPLFSFPDSVSYRVDGSSAARCQTCLLIRCSPGPAFQFMACTDRGLAFCRGAAERKASSCQDAEAARILARKISLHFDRRGIQKKLVKETASRTSWARCMDSLCMDGSEVAACICTNRSSPTCCCRLINQGRRRSSAQPAECRPLGVAGLSSYHVDRPGAPGSGLRPTWDGCCLLSDGRALPEQHGPGKQTVRVFMGPESLRQVWASRLRLGGSASGGGAQAHTAGAAGGRSRPGDGPSQATLTVALAAFFRQQKFRPRSRRLRPCRG